VDCPLALDAIPARLASPQVVLDADTLNTSELVVHIGGELRAHSPALTDQHPRPPAALV
jgi:hypothetical protein